MAEIESDIQWEKERECVRARERERGGGDILNIEI